MKADMLERKKTACRKLRGQDREDYVRAAMKIADTNLSNRAKNALRRNGVFTVEDMRKSYRKGRLHQCYGIGGVTIAEIKKWLADHAKDTEEVTA